MGAAESVQASAASGEAPSGVSGVYTSEVNDSHAAVSPFVVVATAPPGVGKESLMGTFIANNLGRVGYVAKTGAVSAREPGLLYFYDAPDSPPPRSKVGGVSGPHAPNPSLALSILSAMQAALRDGKSVVVDADVVAVRELRAANVPACYVFILPPSLEALHENIRMSYEESGATPEDIRATSAFAENEIACLHEEDLYDFSVENHTDADALMGLQACLKDGLVAAKVLAMSLPPAATDYLATQPASTGARQGPAQLNAPHSGKPPLPSAMGQGSTRGSSPHSTPPQSTGAPRSPAEQLDRLSLAGTGVPPADANGDHPKPTSAVPIPPGMARWRGEVAIVTGASSGIGRAVTLALVSAGVRVVGAARRKERLEAVQAAILASGASGHAFLPVMCDITKEAEVQTLVALAGREFGRPATIIVNNAGVGRSDTSLMDGDSSAWIEMLSTNVLAVAMICREACRAMRRSGRWGHIINVSSLSGHRIPHGIGAGGFYAGTKHAVRAMTEGLRLEARNSNVPLRVSLVSPGVVHTEFFSTMSNQDPATVERYAAMPGLEADDVASAVLYMLSAPNHVDVNDMLIRSSGQLV